jgi:hypothetical protein
MPFENFGQVIKQNESDLRELLDAGEEIERVWAAWSLALKLGAGATPELVSAATTNPSSGLRRHLIVVLAGYGELDILKTFADCDPDPRVRATACLHLLQTRPTDDFALNDFLLSTLAKDTDKIVRATLLSNTVANKLPVPIDQLIELASDAATEVRAAAVKVLKQRHSAKEAVEVGLIDRIKVETDQELLHEISGICADAGFGDRVLIAAKMRDREIRGLLWNYFEHRKARFDWQVLESYADLSEYHDLDYVLELASENALPPMFIWLTEKLASLIRLDDFDAKDLLYLFATLLSRNLPVSMTSKCKSELEEIRTHVRSSISSRRQEGREDLHTEWMKRLFNIDEGLSRLLGDSQNR